MTAPNSQTTARRAGADHTTDDVERAAWHLAGVARGNGASLEALYQLWAPTLLGIAVKMLQNREEAEEVLQDTFVRIWHKAGAFDPDKGTAFVWVYGILRGFCLDRLKFHSRKKRGGTRIIPFDPGMGHEPTTGPQVVAADEVKRVKRALDALDPAERECLQLAVFLEYTHTEIAEELSAPLGTVKGRLRRALSKLRTLLLNHEA